MTGLPWYRHDPEAFIDGCANGNLTLEEVGAYILLIDEMYRRGGPLTDDPRQCAAVLRCDVRVWYRLKAALIRKGKVYATSGGHISNLRVEDELRKQYDMREQRARAARASAASRTLPTGENKLTEAELRCNSTVTEAELNEKYDATALKNKENASANAEHLSGRYRVREEREEIVPSGLVGSSEPTSIDGPVLKAIMAYNERAKRAGWVTARMPIGAQRRRMVRSRIKALGAEGWENLLHQAELQPFLGGANERGWRMDLEFFASERGSTRILEGKYLRPSEVISEKEARRRRAVFEHDGTWLAEWGARPDSAGAAS